MRKLYALLAGLFFAYAGNISAQPFTPDVANFSFTASATNNVAFQNNSTIGNAPGIRKAFWSFGDGSGQWTAPLANTQHHYAAAGNYMVCLKIYRYANNHDSVLSAQSCKTVTIESLCRADFERLAVTSNPLQAIFKAIPTHNTNKKPVRICWTFGDGTQTCINYAATYTGPYTVTKTYAQPGIYEVCVMIRYDGGCEARKCENIRIGNVDSCRADFQRLPFTTNSNPLHAIFKALPWHSNNKKPARICWTFGDGRDTCINYTNSYTGPYTVAHTYQHPGLYPVCVKINYVGGCEARKCEGIRIGRPDTCRADFERVPVLVNNPLMVGFKAIPGHNNNRKPSKVCWQFGDGSDTCINYPENYTGLYNVAHRYNQPGNYEVCVKILYYGGCEARKCRPIELVRPDSCRADFERLQSTANNVLQDSFRALPWHNNNKKPVKICWQFGDGTDTCINYPATWNGPYTVNHHYNQPGQYEVCVKILYQGGCEARKCHPVVIAPPVNCSVRLFEITPSITSLVRGFLAIPNSNPARPPVNVCWNFGDGTDTCITIDPTAPLPMLLIRHTYPGPGIYRACVRVRFQGGCVAEDCREVVIRPVSDICGGFMVDSLMAPRTFRFKGFSIHNPNDEVLFYRWSFGDGSTALGREVTHTYNQAGNYEVCLSIKTRLGCETRICKTVRVPGNNQPALVLTPNPVQHILHAAFFSTHTEQVNIRILNGSGLPVKTWVRNVTTGPNTWDFNVGDLLPGVYTCIVQSPNQLASAIFIKL